MGLFFSLVVLAAMWPAAPAIFRMLGHEPAVADMEVIYLRIMLYAQIVAISVWSTSQFFMGIHRPVIMMYSAICGQVVNVIANYVLIFGKFGLPAMGIAGAAWGTFIGVVVGAAIRLIMYLSRDIDSKFASRTAISVDFGKMYDLLKVGLPAGFGFMMNVAFWGVALFGLVGKFGKEALAATSAVLSCTNVSVMPIVGIGTALTAAVGKAIGRGRKDIAVKQTNLCLKVALIYMGFIGLCFFVFRKSIIAVWSGDEAVIQIGAVIFICAAIFQVFDALAIIYNSSLRGAGDTLWLAAISAIAAMGVLGAGGLLIVRFLPQLGPIGPWIAATLSVISIGIANFFRFKSHRWMRIDLFKRRPVGLPVEIDSVAE